MECLGHRPRPETAGHKTRPTDRLTAASGDRLIGTWRERQLSLSGRRPDGNRLIETSSGWFNYRYLTVRFAVFPVAVRNARLTCRRSCSATDRPGSRLATCVRVISAPICAGRDAPSVIPVMRLGGRSIRILPPEGVALPWNDAQVRVAPSMCASNRPVLLRLPDIFMSSPRPVQIARSLITGPCRRHAMIFQASEPAAITALAIAIPRATQSACIRPTPSSGFVPPDSLVRGGW